MGTSPHEGRLWLGIFQYQRSCLSSISWFKRRLTEVKLTKMSKQASLRDPVLLFFLLIAVCHINQMPASLPGYKMNIVKTEQTTGKPSYYSALLWWDIWIWILICNLYLPSERTQSTTDLYGLFYVLIILYGIKKKFWGIIFWTQTR